MDILLAILIFLINLGGILFITFNKGYFKRKGQNLATKEDIEEITSKVESIKTTLSHISQAKLILADKQYQILVDAYQALIRTFESFNFIHHLQLNDDEAYDLNIALLEKAETEYLMLDARSSLIPLCNNCSEIEKQFSIFKRSVLAYKKHAYDLIFKHSSLISDINSYVIEQSVFKQMQKDLDDYFDNDYEQHRSKFLNDYLSSLSKLQKLTKLKIKELYTF